MSGELRTAMIECWGWWCKRNTFRLFRSFRLLQGARKMFPGVPCWCTEDEFLTMKSWCMMFKVKWYRKLQMIGHGVSFAKDSTGWSKKTVNCNFFLTDPIFLKNAKPQWFLESLDRAVLVFWCFKSVRWMQFSLSEIFQYRAFAAPFKAWTLK